MEYQRFQDSIVVRLERGEEIVERLAALAAAEGIGLAEVTGLGALDELHICVYDTAAKRFYDNDYREPLELVNLSGTITQKEGRPYLHLHASAGNAGGNVYGGHLKGAVVSATGEIIVRVLDGSVGRRFDGETGLNLLDFGG